MSKPYLWNPEKNELLKQQRSFGFEDIVEAIDSGGLLDDLAHPGDRYSNQRLLVVNLSGYAVTVPYVEEEDYVFLKTAFSNRMSNRKYLR